MSGVQETPKRIAPKREPTSKTVLFVKSKSLRNRLKMKDIRSFDAECDMKSVGNHKELGFRQLYNNHKTDKH